MKEITTEILQTAIQEKQVTLLDVREADEYAAGHIPGATNKPLSQIEQWAADLPKEPAYAIICQSGMRSARACAFLAGQGGDVANVLGGTAAFSGELEV